MNKTDANINNNNSKVGLMRFNTGKKLFARGVLFDGMFYCLLAFTHARRIWEIIIRNFNKPHLDHDGARQIAKWRNPAKSRRGLARYTVRNCSKNCILSAKYCTVKLFSVKI